MANEDGGQSLDEALGAEVEGGTATADEPEDGGATRRPIGNQGGVDPAEEATTETDETLEDRLGAMGDEPSLEEGAEEESAGEGPEPSPEEAVTPDDIEAEFLPEGYYTDENGRIHRPDGDFASHEEVVDAIEATSEEAAEFFGDEEESEEPEEGDAESQGPEPIELELGDEERLEIEVEDDETRRALEEKIQKAERVEALEEERAEVEELREEAVAAQRAAEEFEAEIADDPVGFMVERLPDERRQEIAVELLYDDAVLEAVDEKLSEWSRTPHKREVEAERRKRERIEERQEREQRREAEQARVSKAQEIVRTVKGMVPEDMSPDLAEKFVHDAVRDIQEHVRRAEIYPSEFDVEQVPEIVEGRLELYGIDPSAISLNGDERPTGSGITKAEPRGEAAEKLAEEAEKYRETGERLRKARARKKDAASSAPAGVSSPAGGPAGVGSDATLEEALDAVERRAS